MYDGSIGYTLKFLAAKYLLFLSISFRTKDIAFFLKKVPKLNILSVITIY